MEYIFKKPGPKSKCVDVYQKIKSLEVGESIVIHKSEWSRKLLPEKHTLYAATGVLCSKKTLADGSGWVLTRVEA